jgi:hypothetical protein
MGIRERFNRELLPRKAIGGVYHAYLTAKVVLLLILFTTIPYAYDQYNKEIYEEALRTDNLVIQDFKSTFEDLATDQCKTTARCDVRTLLTGLKDKKLIALEYVSQMEHATQLTVTRFVGTIAFIVAFIGALVLLISVLVKPVRIRAIALSSAALLSIAAVEIVYLLGQIPHVNSKFYLLFGILIALVVSASDYLHHVPVGTLSEANHHAKYVAIALQEKHKKWTAILGYSIALITLVIGTISFSGISYFRLVFGDSFLIAPTVGIAIGSAGLLLAFIIGVVSNIRKILLEIEKQIASLREVDEVPNDATLVGDHDKPLSPG